MENYEEAIGIDVSKLTIDAYIHKKILNRFFMNTTRGFKELLLWSKKELGEVLYFYCFENTGYYSLNRSIFLTEKGLDYVEENALTIKRSSGIVRSKTDKLDAVMIACIEKS